MARGAGYPIEEFLEAITAQLDKTQDALRLKAINRPLTFALKDFSMNMRVFVEMDSEGRVTFRPSGPNETGGSEVNIGFTTITRPMIEENTVSLEMTQAPTLAEVGLGKEDSAQLQKLGVRNAAQLRNFQRRAGEDTMSRYSGVNLDRIRTALDLSRPRLDTLVAESPEASTKRPAVPVTPRVEVSPPAKTTPGIIRDDSIRPDRVTPAIGRAEAPTFQPPQPDGLLADRIRKGLRKDHSEIGPQVPNVIRVPPGSSNVHLHGRNLIDAGKATRARLDGRELALLDASETSMTFALPGHVMPGALEVELPNGERETFRLEVSSDGEAH